MFIGVLQAIVRMQRRAGGAHKEGPLWRLGSVPLARGCGTASGRPAPPQWLARLSIFGTDWQTST